MEIEREAKHMKLEVKDIHKSFSEKEILKGISFSVESGKALGLLGRNGAGKTTTIRTIMDVFHANSGEILVDGKKFDPRKIQIGYLPEERGLYPKRKVMDQMVYLARLRGVSKKKAIDNAKKWLERLEVIQHQNVLLETLSKGNQQKVQLASTLVCEPEIVILDEPFSGLDPVNSQILQDVVKELIADGKIVIFSSHQMSYVEEFCEDIVMINAGEVVLDGNLLEIKKEYGKNQLIVSAIDKDVDTLSQMLETQFSNMVAVTGSTKTEVIVKLVDGVTRMDFFKGLSDVDGLVIERFETYKPSLNDIFVAKVGEEA
ncbi:MAG: ATP-binding cassette domain-containing protein [Eubacteriales bacterium]|nr:ATP-binding cassette domain-containing protein [Eubacteriales bacterium]